MKTDIGRQILIQKIENSSILEKSMEKIFLLSKPKVAYLRQILSFLPFHKF